MNSPLKSLGLWLMVILTFLLAYNLFHKPVVQRQKVAYSEFLDRIVANDVVQVQIQGEQIQGTFKDEERFKTFAPDDPELLPLLRKHKVKVVAAPKPEDPLWKSILISWVPMLLLIGLWFFAMRQMQAGSGKAMSFGKSRARLLNESDHPVTFNDVAGVDEAKDELEEIVLFLKNPERFTKFGGRIPKGVLLIGPPGTGKTLLAKAVAGEAEVPFFSISGSDFVEMFVGVGASRVRDLFVQAKKSAPCIIFIDEIDAVGRHRGAGLGGGHDEREQTLNQLLVEMDGFASNEGVILIAATNRPDVLDPALLRPGRFDRRVIVPLPDWKGRLKIFQVHVAKKEVPLAEDVELETVARGTPGFSGADIENLVNEAALQAARVPEREKVEQQDIEEAKDKVLMGAERRSIVLSEQEKTITAYHEAGHAIVARLLPETDPVHKVTIIPRGMALGLTQQLPVKDIHNYSRTYLRNRLAVVMGGRAAEELVFEERTTGAGNDIQQATDLVKKMVCQWGMSDNVGPWAIVNPDHEIFLGRDIVQDSSVSNETAAMIDKEIRHLLEEANNTAIQLLQTHRDGLNAVSSALLERETLTGAEMAEILLTCGYDLPEPMQPDIEPVEEPVEVPDEAAVTSSDVATDSGEPDTEPPKHEDTVA